METGISAITTVMTFLESNSTFSILIGVATAGVVISLIMGIFFRR